MKTSLVIPAYNGLELLTANLPSIVALKTDEVIIIDDASTDDTVQFISSTYPQIILVSHSHNLGFPQTANHGFSQAKNDLVVLLNQDVIPDKDILRIIKPYFTNPRLFAVTFNEQNRSWATVSLIHGLLNYENGQLDPHDHSSFWASGGSAAFRKSLWDDLGGFDPLFSPGYLEDLDLGYRARKRGYSITWSAQALVHHTPESTFSKTYSPRRLNYIKDRNYLFVHWKNLDLKNFLPHFLAVLDRILQHPGFMVPFLMAIRHLPKILSFRKREKTHITLTDQKIFAYV